jgi:hypothetical protein
MRGARVAHPNEATPAAHVRVNAADILDPSWQHQSVPKP